MRHIVKRVDADDSVDATGNLAGGHWYDPALAADLEPGSLRAEGILGDKRAILDPDRKRTLWIGRPHATVLRTE